MRPFVSAAIAVKMSNMPQAVSQSKAVTRTSRKFFIFEYIFVDSESLELHSQVLWRSLNAL